MRWAGTARRPRVLIAGSGVGALEAMLVLRRHAADLCEIELVSPLRDFTVRSPAGDPVRDRRALRLDLGSLAARLGIGFRADALSALDLARREALTRRGERLAYDALILASGMRWREAVPGAVTVWAAPDRVLIESLLSRRPRAIAFCAHPAEPWTLPIYELALAVAGQVEGTAAPEVELLVVTWESRPAELLAEEASEALSAALARAAVRVHGGSEPRRFEGGRLSTSNGSLLADRAVAPPRRDGCCIANLPLDEAGFLPCDGFGRIAGADGVHAVGEVTASPVRHSTIVAEQARAAAEAVAARAGADLEPTPARPVISGKLMAEPAGSGRGNGNGALWWPPAPLAAPDLRAFLTERLGLDLQVPAGGLPIEIELEGFEGDGRTPSVLASARAR